MKTPAIHSLPQPMACGFCLSLMALGWPAAIFGQAYQVQGNYNPQPVQTVSQGSLIPAAYQQQGVPAAGAGMQGYAPSAPAYQPMTYAPQGYVPQGYPPQSYNPPQRTAVVVTPRPSSAVPKAPTYYAPATPMTLPPAYAQQGMYAQPQPYPGAVQPSSPPPVVQDVSVVGGEISALKMKDREHDRRLSALESRGTGSLSTPTTGYTKHTVRQGDSLWGIAERYGVSESAIKAANRRTSDVVIDGETLLIPTKGGSYIPSTPQQTGGTHIVRRGESLSKIAASYRVSMRALQEENGISNPDLVEEGRVLTIPGYGRAVATTKPKSSTRYVSKPTKPKETVVYSDVPAPGSGLGSVANTSGPRGVTSYRVEAGDGIESVARNFSTTPSEIQRINKLSSQRLPAVGEEIIVPLPGSVAL